MGMPEDPYQRRQNPYAPQTPYPPVQSGQPAAQQQPVQQPVQPTRRQPVQPRPAPKPRVNAQRLWIGGVMTALVSALAAVVCVLLMRGVLNVAIFAPKGEGAVGNLTTAGLAAGAAGVAIVATAVLHLLLLGAPQPFIFFGWIVALATAVAILLPFTTNVGLAEKCGSAAVYLVLGLVIGGLLSAVGHSAFNPYYAGQDEPQARF